ncbi:hypothetical protein [Streptomyces sp. HNA39]|uniref:hypothetical protein n=1 Tax=Streptomyces sp. HNA39 TaxID=2850561 RepID=UPI0020100099|nr:hypothetical protein [Streptomyces sp. HNA39]
MHHPASRCRVPVAGGSRGAVLPDEDCCSLLAPRRVTTRAELPHLRVLERRLDLDEVIGALLDSARVMRPGMGEEEPAVLA